MITKHFWENADGYKLKYSEKRVSEGDFIHWSSYTDRFGLESAPPW